ncbi:MAG: four helix bundle protein, partial [Saprospiraceae bacterium]
EAEFGQSKPDFIHKLAIAQKEINETIYWLELLQATNYIEPTQFDSLNRDAIELIKLITSSIKTVKSKLK